MGNQGDVPALLFSVDDLQPMKIKSIKTDADYHLALKEIEALMPSIPDSLEGARLDVLVTLVEAYESKEYPML